MESENNNKKLAKSPPQVFREAACIGCMDFKENRGLCPAGADDILRCVRIIEFDGDFGRYPDYIGNVACPSGCQCR